METHVELRRVRDVMNPDPTSVSPDTPVEEIIALFARQDIDTVPVVDDDDGLIGIVTKLDLLRPLRPAAVREQPDVLDLSGAVAREIMRSGVVTLEADDPVVTAVDLMLETRFHSLPVVSRARGGPPRLVGMVSRGDLMRAFLWRPEPRADMIREVSDGPKHLRPRVEMG